MPTNVAALRRSMLQRRILATLKSEPAPNITTLAERLDDHRPSVSRSLKSLREEGLVVRGARGWGLTEAGVARAEEAIARLEETHRAASELSAKSLSAIQAASGFKVAKLPTPAAVGLGQYGMQSQIPKLMASQAYLYKLPTFTTTNDMLKAASFGSQPGFQLQNILKSQMRMPPVQGSQLAAALLPSEFGRNILRDSLRGISDSISRSMSALNRSLTDALRSPLGQFAVQGAIAKLPDILKWIDELERARGAAQALEESDYGFTVHLWTDEFARTFAGHVPRVRKAIVTKTLLAYTRSQEFEDNVRDAAERSAILRPRLPHIQQVLGAHRRGEYLLSIPCLLNLIEGIIGDVLIFKGSVRKKGNKLYEQNPDGTPKLDKRHKPIVIPGADRAVQLVRESGWQDHEVLRGVSDTLANRMIKERNGIQHGRYLDYGRANLSVRALLVLLVIAEELAEYEPAVSDA